MGTKEKYLFVCDRWLADDEDDHSIVREMPAKGSGIKKPLPRKSAVIGTISVAHHFIVIRGEAGSYLFATILLYVIQLEKNRFSQNS